jgi:hypothetical protein
MESHVNLSRTQTAVTKQLLYRANVCSVFPQMRRAAESSLVTLVARLNVDNSAFMDFFVIPCVGTCSRIVLKENDPRLHGYRLNDLASFANAVQRMSARGAPSFPIYLH